MFRSGSFVADHVEPIADSLAVSSLLRYVTERVDFGAGFFASPFQETKDGITNSELIRKQWRITRMLMSFARTLKINPLSSMGKTL